MTVEEGLPIGDLLRGIGLNPDPIFARVFIDGQLIPKAEWEWAVPQAGQLVTVRVVPTGGQGGGKDALRIVAMIGVIAAAMFAPAALGALGVGGLTTSTGALTFQAALVSATVSIVGSLAVNALIPPTKPKMNDLSGLGNNSPTLSLTGSSNQLAPYAPIPRVYGRHRFYPSMAARPFTEVVGNDQYLRLLFCCGYGPLALSELKIGQTPIDQFSEVEVEIRYGFDNDAPLTLFPDDVYEDALSVLLTSAGGFQQRTSQPNVRELSVDVVFPSGLFTLNAQGQPAGVTVDVQVDYRTVGDVGWTTVSNPVPAVAASLTTNWSGANNDLLFTCATAGFAGNRFSVAFIDSDALSVAYAADANGAPIVYIRYLPGSTTAAQVKAAMDAHSLVASLVTTANAPGNNGTGTIPSTADRGGEGVWAEQFSGGVSSEATFSITDNRPTLVRASRRWTVATPGAQYEVRVKRVTADGAGTQDQVYWSMLRTLQAGTPVQKGGLCHVAMRIKATDQLNGTVDQFNCVAESILPDWTGTTWTSRPTSNPAAVYRDILQGSANARPLADARLDLATLQAFSVRCAATGFEFNQVVDYRTTVFELARDVLAAGRASFALKDGTYSVVEDLAQTTPVQHFTPRNSWGYRGSKTFVDLPHALKVRFVNPEKDWQQDKLFVYADGYSSANATKFETLDVPGVTSATQAWKLGRYHLAVAELRPETHKLWTDVENLVCTRGDLVRVVHDVPQFGAGFGRIKSLALDGGGNATGFTMDDTLTMTAGTNYAVRFRKADGSSLVQQITTVAGEQSAFTFTAAIPSATKPAVGDLCLLGVLGQESVELLVNGIDPGPDLTAKLTLVDAAPAVLTADSGTIPPFDSRITLPAVVPPAMPVIVQVQSDETVLQRDIDGSFQSRIVVTLHFLSGFHKPFSTIEAHYRLTGSTGAWRQLFAPVSGTAVDVTIAPVEEGLTYDVRLRAVDAETGETSDWASVLNHTVVGKTTPPPDVTGLTFDSGGIRWAYPDVPVDFDGFVVRVRPGTSPVWDDAFQLNDVPITSMSYPMIPDGSTRVIMVKGVDVAGNESATPAWILQDVSALVLRNLAQTVDHKALGFPGTKTDCTVVGDNLTADSQTLFWSNDTALFWSSDSALFWNGTYKNMSYAFTVTPSANWMTGIMRLQVGISAQGWSLTYRAGSPALFWSSDTALFWSNDSALFWSQVQADYVTWPGALEFPKAQDYEFLLSAVGGQVQGVVSLLKVLFDMPDLREAFTDLVISIGGARIPLTKTFRHIKSVAATPKYDGGTMTKLQTFDHQLTPGPLLIGYDDAGAQAAGLAGGTVDGY